MARDRFLRGTRGAERYIRYASADISLFAGRLVLFDQPAAVSELLNLFRPRLKPFAAYNAASGALCSFCC